MLNLQLPIALNRDKTALAEAVASEVASERGDIFKITFPFVSTRCTFLNVRGDKQLRRKIADAEYAGRLGCPSR